MSPARPKLTGLPTDPRGLADMLGGPRGILDAGIPGILFAVVYGVNGQDLEMALWVAIASGVVLFVLSIVQRRSVQHALGGLVGLAIMAFFAARTGRAENFFLPSVLKNAAYALAYLVSIVVRWPLIGVILGPLLGEGTAWRKVPARRRAYMWSSWVWVGLFGLRFAIQLPLYLAGAVTALGIINVFLGIPLFALACWLTWLILRRVPVVKRPDEPDEAGQDEGARGEVDDEVVESDASPSSKA